MDLINCEECGVLLDKTILIENLKESNKKKEYLNRTNKYACPVCKKKTFVFYDEDI